MKNYLLLLSLAISSCTFAQQDHIISDNHVKERRVEPFNSVIVSGAFTVHYSSGNEFQLAVSASDENSRERVKTRVVGQQLEISLEGSSWKNWGSKSQYTIYLSSPKINKIVASGAVDFDVHDQINTDELQLVFSGASDFSGKINAGSLNAVFSGGSDLKATGKVDKVKMSMSGASDCKCFDLKTDIAEIAASGASDIKISVYTSINATASGASDVEYMGSPISIQTRVSGASSITKKGS